MIEEVVLLGRELVGGISLSGEAPVKSTVVVDSSTIDTIRLSVR